MGRCSVVRRLHRRAGSIGQKYLITKGQQPETYDQQADDDGRTDDTTSLYSPTSNFQIPVSQHVKLLLVYSISNVNCSAVAIF